MDSITLQALLDELWPELPSLVGDAWPTVAPALTGYHTQLAAGTIEPVIAQSHILRILSTHPRAFRRLLDLTVQHSAKNAEGTIRGVKLVSGNETVAKSSVNQTSDTPTLTRYIDISCSRRIWVETPRFSVVLRLTLERPAYSATSKTLPGLTEAPVQVRLTSSGFATLNAAIQETPVLSDQDSPPLIFDLKPLMAGHHQLIFDFFQNGQPLRTVTVAVHVTTAEVAEDAPTHARQSIVTLAGVQPPDLVLHISWDKATRSLAFVLIRNGGASWREFPPMLLPQDPAAHTTELYRRITSLVNVEDSTAQALLHNRLVLPTADVDRRLRQLGHFLWENLIPPDFRLLYADERDHWRNRSFLIYSDEPHLPWELIWPYDEREGDWVDEAPWCVTLQLTRWLRRDAQGNGNDGAPGVLALRAGAVLAPTYTLLSDLPLARTERTTILSLFQAHNVQDVTPSTATWRAVMDLLEAGGYDWVHLAAHGNFHAQDPTGGSAIWLDQENALTPEHIGGPLMLRHFHQRRPAFVFNACEVGRQGWELTHIGGWANRLLQLNAGLFIGPLWSVSDSGASTFSGTLYSALLDGETIGRAVQKARLAARTDGDPTWLAYSVYAHPNARVAMS